MAGLSPSYTLHHSKRSWWFVRSLPAWTVTPTRNLKRENWRRHLRLGPVRLPVLIANDSFEVLARNDGEVLSFRKRRGSPRRGRSVGKVRLNFLRVYF